MICWFLACMLFAPLAWLLRRPLMRMSLLGPVSLGTATVTLGAFAMYVRTIVNG